MKQTKFKFSLGMKLVSILSCIALVSVGFASWWIVNYPAPKELSDGSFEVYSVDEKNIYFDSVSFGSGKDNALVIFGYPTGAEDNKGWFGYSTSGENAVQEEDLQAVLSFTLKIDDGDGAINDYVENVFVDFTPNDTDFAGLVDNYISAPVITYSLNGGVDWKTGTTYSSNGTKLTIPTTDMTSSSQVIQVRFEFGWGETFNDDTQDGKNINPYDFYNKQTYSKSNATSAKATMTEIAKLADATYTVNLSTSPEGTATAPAN